MNYLQCEYCRQRFYTGAGHSHVVAGCLLCGGSLRTINGPPERPSVVGPAEHRPPLPLALLPLAAADPGSYPEGRTCYRSLSDFSRSEVSRIPSREPRTPAPSLSPPAGRVPSSALFVIGTTDQE